MKQISIHWKVMVITFFIVVCSFIVAGIFVLDNAMKSKEAEIRERSMLMARTVAELPELQLYLMNGDVREAAEKINPVVEKIRVINKADYIVVLNKDRIRLSHPVKSMLGTKSQTVDEDAAFTEHTYISKAKGEAGTMMRAFMPVLNKEHNQIGVVVSGYLMPSIWDILWDVKMEIFLAVGFAFLFAGWGAWTLAGHMKNQMFGLEPHEIARLYAERSETFNAMHEGIIAIDSNLTVTIFNHKARKILGVDGEVIGKNIYDILPDTRLPEILDFNYPIYNKELSVNRHSILSNRIPIEVEGKTVGAVAVFQDRTEVKKLAEELTGFKAFVQALRVQNHEHMNKMHTLGGLLQLGKYQAALDYIFQVKEEQAELTNFLKERIKDDSLSGLLLSKVSHGKELGITVEIDNNSKWNHCPENLDHHDLVIILGNLIENAFEALRQVKRQEKKVFVSLDYNEDGFSIMVEDNGVGMDQQTINSIFENGFTTKKEAGHGIGLHLVNEIAMKGNGTVDVDSYPDEGTSIIITF
ncbi:ATP-binding protein [Bacillus testis]|uniref:ATP-binding protein n=1 Tax=Bacillus testis TaxID=1622072 RepID=UPI00067EECBF|nr:sensor histidine kinase [Bacillus testis]